MAGDDEHTVSDAMQRFEDYEWLADVRETDDGGWMMLYAPSADPDEDTVESFTDDMDYLMESSNLDTVTEIGNGWIISTEGNDGDA